MERINEEVLREARGILQKYKDGKKVLEARVREEEKWYRLRHWEVVRGEGDAARPQPTSAWLFNAIMNKHADAMDNFPECSVLPREDGDREDAKTLSAIIPVILERCEFEKVYSYNWWEKLKHGTAIYGSFWNPRLENGLGDVDIKPVDILNIFWEPGIQDIQDSRNVFVLDLRDNDLLEREYPQLEGKLGGDRGLDLPQYEHDLTLDLTGKSAVVDWYYKVRAEDGRTLVHYVKFVGETLLFASEDMDEYLIIELVRQFYDQERSFRITGGGVRDYDFVRYSNVNIRTQQVAVDSAGNPLMRRPVFDVRVKAQKKNPFSRMSQNELAKELYGLGVFNPERAQETEGMLEMMEFEGKDRVLEQVRQKGAEFSQLQQPMAQPPQGMSPGGGDMLDLFAGKGNGPVGM